MEDTSRRIRNSIGTFVWFLDYYVWLAGSLFRKKAHPPENPKSILVVDLCGIGDVIGSTPVVYALKERYREAGVDMLVSEETVPLLLNNPFIRSIIPFNSETQKKIRNNYDIAVLLAPGSRKISRLLKDAKIPFRIGCRRRGIPEGKGFYLTRKAKPFSGIHHTIDSNLNVLKTIGINAKNRTPKLFTTSREDKNLALFLEKNKIKSRDFVAVLSPGSKNIEKIRHPSHLWPLKRFAEIGDFLAREKKAKIILVGLEKEKELATNLSFFMKSSSVNLAGKLSLGQLMVLMKRANLVVAVDSGPMHIAEAFNTPLVALFGPQNPKRWMPLSEKSVSLYKEEVCTGCQRYSCKRKNNICMKKISVDDMINAVRGISR
jgi:lipopolysaccharide heptosyltransferase II